MRQATPTEARIDAFRGAHARDERSCLLLRSFKRAILVSNPPGIRRMSVGVTLSADPRMLNLGSIWRAPVASTQNGSPDRGTFEEEDVEAAADQARYQAEAMLKYFDLTSLALVDILQNWTKRRQLSMQQSLARLHTLSGKRTLDELSREYMNLWIEEIRGLGTDVINTGFKALSLLQRNLLAMQRTFGQQAMAPVNAMMKDALRAAVLGDPLTAYDGWIGVDLDRTISDSETEVSRVKVIFSQKEPIQFRHRARILIEDGEHRDRIRFQLRLDIRGAHDVIEPTRYKSIELSAQSDSEMVEFMLDPGPPPDGVWAMVYQAGRLIQVVEVAQTADQVRSDTGNA
jgi:hypothetical protein